MKSLKVYIIFLLTLNSKDRETTWIQQTDKIIFIVKTLFESFNKSIIVFLTNYVKFIELQYNLQEIKNVL
jgi:hypothetical protein